jgi:hypothetical protein
MLKRSQICGEIRVPAKATTARIWSVILPGRRGRSGEEMVQHGGFAQNAVGTFGNSGRNIVPGPGLAQVNFMISKSFTVYRESSLQFRAEFFNMNQPSELHCKTDGTADLRHIRAPHQCRRSANSPVRAEISVLNFSGLNGISPPALLAGGEMDHRKLSTFHRLLAIAAMASAVALPAEGCR